MAGLLAPRMAGGVVGVAVSPADGDEGRPLAVAGGITGRLEGRQGGLATGGKQKAIG